MAKKNIKSRAVILDELVPGQIMLEVNSRRLVKVIGKDTITIHHRPTPSNDNRGRVEQLPAVRVHCTIPTVEIDGLVTKKGARAGKRILIGCMGIGDDDDYDNRVWQEVWATRMVGIIIQKEGAATVSEEKFRPQTYCHQVEDMNGNIILGPGVDPTPESMTLRSSGIYRSEVTVIDIPKSWIHDDPWVFPKVEEAVA